MICSNIGAVIFNLFSSCNDIFQAIYPFKTSLQNSWIKLYKAVFIAIEIPPAEWFCVGKVQSIWNTRGLLGLSLLAFLCFLEPFHRIINPWLKIERSWTDILFCSFLYSLKFFWQGSWKWSHKWLLWVSINRHYCSLKYGVKFLLCICTVFLSVQGRRGKSRENKHSA